MGAKIGTFIIKFYDLNLLLNYLCVYENMYKCNKVEMDHEFITVLSLGGLRFAHCVEIN